MANIPQDTSGLPDATTGTASSGQIPSVVGTGPKTGVGVMLLFLGCMVVIGLIVCRKPQPREETPEASKETVSTLPPALATTRTVVPFETLLSKSGNSIPGGESLWDIRRKSPMVILNKTQDRTPVGLNQPDAGSLDPQTGLALSPNSSSASCVPLPRGFTPNTTQSVHATTLGDRDYLIAQGKLIDAILETSINSDHPGMLRALVSHDLYGDTGRNVLLPRGTRLIGQYDSAIAKGQNRVFVLWERAIRPDGVDIQLGSAGTDPLGGTGIEGDVNYHFWAMFGAATLLSVIGGAASTVGVSPSDQNNSLAQFRENIANGFNSAAGTVLGQFAQIKPTITVRQGIEIKVFVARDLYFDPTLLNGNGVGWIQ
jgi:hypothetical protein